MTNLHWWDFLFRFTLYATADCFLFLKESILIHLLMFFLYILSFANFTVCLRAKIKHNLIPLLPFLSNNDVLLVVSAGESAIRCCLHASFGLLQLNLLKRETWGDKSPKSSKCLLSLVLFFSKPIFIYCISFCRGASKLLFMFTLNCFKSAAHLNECEHCCLNQTSGSRQGSVYFQPNLQVVYLKYESTRMKATQTHWK